MMTHNLKIILNPGTYAVARLDPDMEFPEWAFHGELISITRTSDELSIVCATSSVPEGIRAERNFRCLQVAGPLEFTEVGVLESLARPLAEAGISIFAVSTYDTDYLFLSEADMEEGVAALTEAGHSIQDQK
jgi:hypothetical protein